MMMHLKTTPAIFWICAAFQSIGSLPRSHASNELEDNVVEGRLRRRAQEVIEDYSAVNETIPSYTSEIDCTDYYALPGNRRYVPALPDQNSRYDLAFFQPNTGVWDAIRLDGEYPYARYFSLNIYDRYSGITLLSLKDSDITPLEGNTNPYRPGSNRFATERGFSFFLIPEGSSSPVPEGTSYVEIPSDLEEVAIVTRVYRADEGLDTGGGVPPPSLTFLSLGEDAECPIINQDQSRQLQEDNGDAPSAPLDLIFYPANTVSERKAVLRAQGDQIYFHRNGGSQYWENKDIFYATGALPDSGVSVVRFRVPTFEDTFQGSPVFVGGTDVRYWSICIGGLGLSLVSNCLRDDQIDTDAEGIATVVIGPNSVATNTVARNMNFLPRGVVVQPLVLFRQLVANPEFEGRFSLSPLPNFSTKVTLEEVSSKDIGNYIGDYGPSGQHFRTTASYRRWLNAMN